VFLEQCAKDDPRGVLLLRAEKLTRMSLPFVFAEWRIPLDGLTQELAESHFRDLETFMCERAGIDTICARRRREDSAVS
jgi:hypothetical protein